MNILVLMSTNDMSFENSSTLLHKLPSSYGEYCNSQVWVNLVFFNTNFSNLHFYLWIQ